MTTITDNSVSSSLMAAMNPKQATAKSDAIEAQDRFMKLLVTQMKNQDPLNPLDNAQMTSQLAQLSTVTGIDKLNTTLESLMSDFQAGQSLQATSMIGHAVMAPGSDLALASGKALLGIELTEPADNVKVAIHDAAGKVVHTMDLGSREVGAWPLAWDGMTDAGVVAADGQYTFDVTATRGGQKISATALAFGEVGSVSTSAQGVKLNVSNLGAINLADVRQIL